MALLPDTPPAPAPIQRGNQVTKFVVLVVVIAAYFPVLTDPDLSSLSPAQIALLFGLGLIHLILATLVYGYLEDGVAFSYLVIFFAVQIGLILAILIVGREVSGGLWLLALPTVAQSLALNTAGTIAVCLALLGGMAGLNYVWGADPSNIIEFIIAIGAAMIFTLVFTNIAVRAQEARAEVQRLANELSDANQQLREYAVQAEELATTQERNRLAREIHDTLGHYLTIINVQLNAAQAVFEKDPPRAQAAIEQAQKLTQEGLAEVRQSVAALRTLPTTGRPLPAVLETLAAETRAAGLVTNVTVTGEPRPLDPRTALTLYRAAQEGLTNARKHAHASRLDLGVDYQAPDSVHLTIQDNGVGAVKTEGGFGLLGLRERVQLLGGEVTVNTAPGHGFTLSVRVPG